MKHLDEIPLLPAPRSVLRVSGFLRRPAGGGTDWPALTLETDTSLFPQDYRLEIHATGVRARAGGAAGAFYARQTLTQLLRLCPDGLPCGEIEDSPDVTVRGVMLDISRDKVPTLETMFLLVDMLAEWKVNHLQLYMEHTFAYRNHREVWAEADPFTAQEIRALDAYCRERFVELAPNQNSFGHMERWLKHPRYRPLAEFPEGSYVSHVGARHDKPTTLDPTNPASVALAGELFAELVPCFTSRRLHIGCDETWELGQGRSKAAVERDGLHRVYLDHLRRLDQAARQAGCTSLYWGDMVWNRFPDKVYELDREMVHVDWGYYRAYPFQQHGELLASARVPFWFASGTSTWNTLVGCNEAALGSNRSAARAAASCGAGGVLNTDWGDGGHWQHLPVSFIGLAAGAATAWCERANTDDRIRAGLDPHVFRDPAGVMGRAAYDLADTWQLVGENATNGHLLDHMLRGGLERPMPEGVTGKTLRATLGHLDNAVASMAGARMGRPDADLVRAEFADNARLAAHACRIGLAVLSGRAGDPAARRELAEDLRGIVAERRSLWLARNRQGGLADSLRLLEKLADGYLA